MNRCHVTLEELLASRDTRRLRQHEWHCTLGPAVAQGKASLVVGTIIMPGPVKRSQRSLKVASAALKALRSAFAGYILRLEEFDLHTGYEIFLAVSLSADAAKEICCKIEDTHPLGRLFDIDVIGSDLVPLSRTALSLPPRKCLMCEQDARICMRTQAHSYDELLATIEHLTDNYTDDCP